MIAGTIILASSTTVAQLIVGRIVTGFVRRQATLLLNCTDFLRAMASTARQLQSIKPNARRDTIEVPCSPSKV